MFTSNCLVRVNPFNNGNPDINGKDPVILTVIAGKAPNRIVLAGTVAETAGFEVGKVYYAQCREVERNEYGRQFRWTPIQEVESVMDTVNLSEKLGEAKVFDATGFAETAKEQVKEAVKAGAENDDDPF